MAQGTFHIITFGCQMNVNDSFWLARSLQRRGFVESPLEKAEVVILNTCSVRDKPEQKVYAALGRIKYETRRVPGSFAVVAGCVAQQIGAGFFERFPQVRLVVGGDGLAMAPDAIERLHGDPSLRLNLTDFSEIYPERDPALPAQGEGEIPPVAFVNIMQGCDNFCTYCIVPYTRGRERSRDPESIVREVQRMAQEGYREVTLLGQNVNSYCWQSETGVSYTFADLLRKVAEAVPTMRIRFTSPHPKDMKDETLEVMSLYPNICRHIHFPLQSGSNRILERMHRRYTREWYLERVERIRDYMPDCGLSTDVFCGFSGETEEDFQETLEVMRRARLDSAFMFKYSERPGTYASRHLVDDVPEEVKVERLNRMIALQNELSLESNERDVGKSFEVLIEGYSKRSHDDFFGRTQQNKVIVFPKGHNQIGKLVTVRVERVTSATMIGSEVEG